MRGNRSELAPGRKSPQCHVNMIYLIKQEGLYQNKVTVSLASIHNCKMAYSKLNYLIFVNVRIVQFISSHSTHTWKVQSFFHNCTSYTPLVYSIHLTLELCCIRTFFFIFNVVLAHVYRWFI